MPLLNPSQSSEQKTIDIRADILAHAEQYCQYANLASIDDMINQSLEFVMKKDKEFYKKYVKNS